MVESPSDTRPAAASLVCVRQMCARLRVVLTSAWLTERLFAVQRLRQNLLAWVGYLQLLDLCV